MPELITALEAFSVKNAREQISTSEHAIEECIRREIARLKALGLPVSAVEINCVNIFTIESSEPSVQVKSVKLKVVL